MLSRTPLITIARSPALTVASTRLEACPFCGRKNSDELGPNIETFYSDSKELLYFVLCLNLSCHAQMGGPLDASTAENLSVGFVSPEVAVNCWNRRAQAI